MDKRHFVLMAATTVAWTVGGCSADERLELEKDEAEDDAPRSATASRLVVPVDTRPPFEADAPPPPITGGTLLVTSAGLVIAADPARDRLSVVDPALQTVVHIDLQPGDEPGRIAEDSAGRVHVALRRGAAVVSVDPEAAAIVARRTVCGAPRGIATDDVDDAIYVACAGGEVMRLPADGGDATLVVRLAPGLRDVLIDSTGMHVTNFKSATLRSFDDDGPLGEVRGPAVTMGVSADGELVGMLPTLAWKAARGPGGIYMLHQRASTATIALEPDGALGDGAAAYGGTGDDDVVECSAIVQTAVTRLGDDPEAPRIAAITAGVLAVDLAVSATGLVAIALAGAQDTDAPRRFTEVDDGSGEVTSVSASAPGMASGLALMEPQEMHPEDPFDACTPLEAVDVEGQITAVAFLDDGRLVAQSRQPARIYVGEPRGEMVAIELGGQSVRDTGHALFHRDAGAGVACASCHAEGGDDGHVWSFSSVGRRRTQAVHVGLEDTAPFHWDGDMPDLTSLMNEVFVSRMGGVHQSDERVDALRQWMFSLRPPAPVRQFDADDLTLSLGKRLFDSEETGCAGCHGGSKFTNNSSVDVGTGAGHALQVPSLVGIAYRAPFIHNGCAQILRDRFDPDCGGDEHGDTAWLNDTQLDALIAYMETF